MMLRKTMLSLGAMFVLAATPALASDGTAGRFDTRARAAIAAVEAPATEAVIADDGSGSDACPCSSWPRYAPSREHLRH